MVQIDDDVQNVANNLSEIDDHLRLRYSEAGEFYVVYWKPHDEEEGSGYMVTTAQELDQRIVTQVREVYAKVKEPGYSFAAELDRVDREAQEAEDKAFTEANMETYERLAFALRQDTGRNTHKIVVPKEVPSA